MKKLLFAVLLLIAFESYCFAQETCAGYSEGCTSAGMPIFRNECNYTEQEFEDLKNITYSKLLEENSTFEEYNFFNLTYVFCYESEEKKQFNGNILIKQTQNSAKGYSAYFNAEKTEEFNITYIGKLYVAYDFEQYFTETENNALSYELKQMIIDSIEKDIWVVVSQKYEEINGEYQLNCNTFKQNFESLAFEKKYKESQDYCTGYVKLKTSEIRGMIADWIGYISYFGNSLRYIYSGTASLNNDIDLIANSLNNCLVYKYTEMDYSTFNDEDIKSASCIAGFMDKKRIYASRYSSDGNFDILLSGFINETAVVDIYISKSSKITDSDKQEAVDFANEFLNKYFGKTAGFDFSEISEVEPMVLSKVSATVNPNSEESITTYAHASGQIKLDYINNEELQKLEKDKQTAVNSYFDNDTFFYIGEKYIEILKKEPNEELNFINYYNFLTISETGLTASVELENEDESLARSNLTEKFSEFLNVNDLSWEITVDYSSDQPVYYMLEAGAEGVGVARKESGEQETAFLGFASDVFTKEAIGFDISNIQKTKDNTMFFGLIIAAGIIVFTTIAIKYYPKPHKKKK